MIEERVFFCHKECHGGRNVLVHFERSKERLEFLYHLPNPIVKTLVREVKPGEASPYWGWWDNEKSELHFIWPSRIQLELCFACGTEVVEKQDKGRAVNLIVTEVPE